MFSDLDRLKNHYGSYVLPNGVEVILTQYAHPHHDGKFYKAAVLLWKEDGSPYDPPHGTIFWQIIVDEPDRRYESKLCRWEYPSHVYHPKEGHLYF